MPVRADGSMRVQDYVKWRGQLFHQFLRALVDDSHQVRSLAGHLLADALATKVGPPVLAPPAQMHAQQQAPHGSCKGAERGPCDPSHPPVRW